LNQQKKRGVRRLIPIFWIDQEIKLSEKMINKLRTPLWILENGRYIFLPSAIALAIIIIVIIELVAKHASRHGRYTRGAYTKAETLVHH